MIDDKRGDTVRGIMDREQTLETLLRSLYRFDAVALWLRRLPGGRELLDSMQPNLSPAAFFAALVEELTSRGLPDQPLFWSALLTSRPQRGPDIAAARAEWCESGGVAPAVLTVLMVSASPYGEARLRVDEEYRHIFERVQAAEHRDRFHFVPVPAARIEDLRTALMRHRPHVLHISAHGEQTGSLLFEGTGVDAQQASRRELTALIASLRDNLRLVVLNACDSYALARELQPIVGAAIGMSEPVTDAHAIAFAVTFYEALAFGRDIASAFEVALAHLGSSERIPRLFPSVDQDPDGLRRRSLLAPRRQESRAAQ